MKTTITRFVVLSIALLFTSASFAYDVVIDGIAYNIDKDTKTAEVTINLKDNKKTPYSGSVTIPSSISYDGMTFYVTSIGGQAFSYSDLTSVIIPNSIVTIKTRAFYCCTSLTEICIPNSVTKIDREAFAGCSKLTSLIIPNSITKIERETFAGCSKVTSITIPNSVTCIGIKAFSFCSSLTEITIPSSVTCIESGVFTGCYSITEIYSLNPTPPTIDYFGFDLTDDDPDPFCSISKVDSKLYVPEESVEKYKSAGSWSQFKNILAIGSTYEEEEPTDSSVKVGDIYYKVDRETMTAEVIGKKKEEDSYPYGYTLTIPSSITYDGLTFSVTSIGSHAFEGCYRLGRINIPNSLTSIGYGAFQCCEYLHDIIIPDAVTTIGDAVFIDCLFLQTITLGRSVTSIGRDPFTCCDSLRELYSLNPTPPAISFRSYNYTYKVPLYVPDESVEKYKTADGWSTFEKILPIGATSIEQVAPTSSQPSTLYDLSGKEVTAPRAGQIVIKKQGGKTVKYKM